MKEILSLFILLKLLLSGHETENEISFFILISNINELRHFNHSSLIGTNNRIEYNVKKLI